MHELSYRSATRSRARLALAVTAWLAFGWSGCGSGPEPTEEQLDSIDAAAQRAADRITPENADAEFEKLKHEMDHK